jgi:hypothetical protein
MKLLLNKMNKLMFKYILIVFLLIGFGLESCNSNKHFISDKEYREKVELQFEKQKQLAINRDVQLFDVFKKELSIQETEALKFLYAYMPLSDLADYDGNFYLKNIQSSFKAKNFFSWGDDVPENLFRHFVLPVRVNNETMDTARLYFFEELKNRVKDLSMKEAVLEVNHWCHEKVVYKSTDSRTSGPLNTIKTAYGRCGEESTFTTAALRAVGIPARQCYTPRWAHSDDNHAWVEVWVDGKWHFIGACEPEPDLDLAWFTGPAKRAMLVNTTVYGDYSGDEEVLEKTQWFTKINILSNYTETKTVFVKVIDESGKPIEGAQVDFCLYNYAEFFPLSKRKSDKNGIASFLTGKGDLMIFVNFENKIKYEKLDVRLVDTLYITPNQKTEEEKVFQNDLIAPVEVPIENKPNEEMVKKNSTLLQLEDSIRRIYTNTFFDSTRSVSIAEKLKMNFDSIRYVLEKSCGNHQTILNFLNLEKGSQNLKLSFLYSLSEKDLRDVSEVVLLDHFLFSKNLDYTENDFVKYVMNPRIGIEMARPYKEEFQKSFSKNSTTYFRTNPEKIVEWVKEQITIVDSINYYKISISPLGVHQLRLADIPSRNAYFVAMSRSLGIAARIETSTKKPQYLVKGKWIEVNFDKSLSNPDNSGQGSMITLVNSSKQKDFKPVYSIHFSLAVFENGRYKTLDFEENPIMNNFPVSLPLSEGNYLLVTGARKPDGSVLNSMKFFNIIKGKNLTLDISPRDLSSVPTVIGKINMEESLTILGKSSMSLKGIAKEKGIVLIWLGPEKEPTKHVLAELLPVKSKFENWGGGFVLIAESEEKAQLFNTKKHNGIPFQNLMSFDEDSKYLSKFLSACKKQLPLEFPVLVYVNLKGEIQYLSNGYQIGNVEMIEKVVKKDVECQKSCVVPQ